MEGLVYVFVVSGRLDVVPELYRVLIRGLFFGMSYKVTYVFDLADEFLCGGIADSGGGL